LEPLPGAAVLLDLEARGEFLFVGHASFTSVRRASVRAVRPLLLFIAVFAPCDTLGAQSPPERPNVVLILADDLGWGDLGSNGQEKLRTPHLDRLADEGTRFTDFYAGSTVCAPSRCVLMTGLHTGRAIMRGNRKDSLRPEDVTVAEVLKARGYATGLFGKWGLGQEGTDGVPTRQGFDAFLGYLDQTHAHNYYPSFLVEGEGRRALRNVVPKEGKHGQGVASEKVDYAPDAIHEGALAFVRAHAEEPFFLYYASTIPHANNEAGKRGMEVPDLGEFAETDWPAAEQATAAMVAHLDAQVGELVALLDELDIAERTLVLFTSDNGPHREGGRDPAFFDSNGPLRGIKRDLYEGGIRVPLIARMPGTVPAGATSAHVASFADVLATLAELAGAETPEGLTSHSFVAPLLGRAGDSGAPYHYWEFYERGSAQALRSGRWKAVRKPMLHGALELYDLAEDVGESRDVAAEHPQWVEQVARWMDEAHVPSNRWKPPPPEGGE
jgi:arylsulfatase A-like enzyme